MNHNYKYLINEKAQLFIKIDNKETEIDYKDSFSNIGDIGINSIQIFADEINTITAIDKINSIASLGTNNIVLNLTNICEEIIPMLTDKISYISLLLTEKSVQNKVSLVNKLKMKNKNIGINLKLFDSEDWLSLINIIINKYDPPYIILDPNYVVNKRPSMNQYWNNFNQFQEKIKGFTIPIYMAIGIYDKRFLMDHPCNIYMCSGEDCHTDKGNKVRRLSIDLDGNVLPESFDFNKSYIIGNIKEENLLDIINSSLSRGLI